MDERTTLYLNGTIHTLDGSRPPAQSMLVREGRIAAIGGREEVEGQARGAERVDLEGRSVVPGFNDCHCHILAFGLNLGQLDVSADTVHSIEDIQRVVARQAERSAENEWVTGRGYDQNVLRERRHPTRADLDQPGRGRPVVLWHTSGHALTCNSKALELAGISGETRTPAGGEIERDEHGRPNGVLKESAMNLLAEVIPPPSVEAGRDAILRAMEVMASQGMTSASDAATGQRGTGEAVFEMYRGALDSGRLSGRIVLMPQIELVAPPDSDEVHGPDEFDAGTQPDWLRVGATKIFSDGALTTRTAALRRPFVDTDSTGLLLWEPETLAGMIRRAHGAGWQIGTHAIGDRAVEVVLDCYRRALSATPRLDHRHRIEHCMLLDENLGRQMKELGIIPTIQPGFMSRLGDAYIVGLGMERASQLMPMGLFERLGIPVGFSSDRPVIPGDPLDGVRAAVRRRTPEGVLLGQEHMVTTMEAIRFYTQGSAHATHSENEKGMLRPGMFADFAVLSADPATMPPEDLDELRVTTTIAGGRPTWSE